MKRCWACCSDVDCDARRDEHLQLHAGPSSNEPLYVLVAETANTNEVETNTIRCFIWISTARMRAT
jgi:hypothetical protein